MYFYFSKKHTYMDRKIFFYKIHTEPLKVRGVLSSLVFVPLKRLL